MMSRLAAVLALASLALVAGCSEPPPPVSVSEGMVTVLNQTDQDWKQVLITVNDHYQGVVPTLKAEGRANAPLAQFNTGHGQRWPQGTYVKTIDVTAKAADGTDVKLSWGREEKR
ncbi:MAG: hypothetical protein M3468_08545 [Acidobacteriota bacterium]|nr:hypothetical protein [Acidobacteriota bacterium]